MKRSYTASSGADSPATGHVSSTWPGAFGIYNFSRKAVKRNLVPLLQLWAGYLIVVLIITGVSHSTTIVSTIASSLVSLFLGSVFTVITTRIFLAGVRGRHMSVGKAF